MGVYKPNAEHADYGGQSRFKDKIKLEKQIADIKNAGEMRVYNEKSLQIKSGTWD